MSKLAVDWGSVFCNRGSQGDPCTRPWVAVCDYCGWRHVRCEAHGGKGAVRGALKVHCRDRHPAVKS